MKKLLSCALVLLLLVAVLFTSCEVEKPREEASGETLKSENVSGLVENEKDALEVFEVAEGITKGTDYDYDLTVEVTPGRGDSFSLLSADTVSEYNKDVTEEDQKISVNNYKKITYFIDQDEDANDSDDYTTVLSKYSYELADGTSETIVIYDADDESAETETKKYNADKLHKDFLCIKDIVDEDDPDENTPGDTYEVGHREAIDKLLEIAGDAPVIKLTYNSTTFKQKVEAEIKLTSEKGGVSASVKGSYVDNETGTEIASIDASFSIKLSDDFDIITVWEKDSEGYWDDDTEFKGDVTLSIDKLNLMCYDDDEEDGGKVEVSLSGNATFDTEAITLKAALVLNEKFNDESLLAVDAEYEGPLSKKQFAIDNLKIYKAEISGKSYSAESVRAIISFMLNPL